MMNIWLSFFIVVVHLSLGAEAGCAAPALPAGMSRTPETADNANIENDATLEYSCISGFTSSAASETITCTSGSWDPVSISLTCTGCAAPALPAGMTRTPATAEGNGVANDATLEYSCISGFTSSAASETITCTSGSWDPVSISLTCTGCAAPALPTGMTRTPATAEGNGVANDATLEYSCISGFTASAASETITCTSNAWAPVNNPLTCTGCAAPALPTGMTRTPETAEGNGIANDASLVYTCLNGYTASAVSETITCTSGAWAPVNNPLTCTGCAAPALPTGMTRTPETAEGNGIANDASLVYTCLNGYTASAVSETITCTSGAWDPMNNPLTCTGSGAQTNMGFGLPVAFVAIVAHVLTSRV
ncbi:hypothetical protein ScPMuIL_002862 [Solemya velum]